MKNICTPESKFDFVVCSGNVPVEIVWSKNMSDCRYRCRVCPALFVDCTQSGKQHGFRGGGHWGSTLRTKELGLIISPTDTSWKI